MISCLITWSLFESNARMNWTLWQTGLFIAASCWDWKESNSYKWCQPVWHLDICLICAQKPMSLRNSKDFPHSESTEIQDVLCLLTLVIISSPSRHVCAFSVNFSCGTEIRHQNILILSKWKGIMKSGAPRVKLPCLHIRDDVPLMPPRDEYLDIASGSALPSHVEMESS